MIGHVNFRVFDRKAHWERVYAEKSPFEVSWYQAEPKHSLELIRNTKISKEAPILDVGGGTSVLVERLRANGYQQLGVLDVSATALNYTRLRLREEAKSIRLV